ncbi:MAG TPA: alpha/beta hydrolase family protein [Pyrinomonadaceae bacterium]|jgi:S-formylglutathione hydrolase FrmB
MNQISTQIVRLYSSLNRGELPYYAILPADYESSDEVCGVLYLLHGLFGRFDNWITNTNLIDYARNFPFIIICAEGRDSWYTDSTKIENHLFESYLTQELIPDVERRFKARAERRSRAIGGLSMGGYGAFKLAFRNPEMFCLAASMSGAFHAAQIIEDPAFNEWHELQPSILKVFGSNNPQIRQSNDLFRLVNDFPYEKINQLPYFYFDCGFDDSFLRINLSFAEMLRKKGIAHKFRQFAGGHDWNYWDKQIRQILWVTQIHLSA